MIDADVSAFFFQELSKEAAIGGKHIAGASLLAGGAVLGSKGKDALQDRNEGKILRLQRELQQKQMFNAMKNRGGGQGGY